MKKETIFNLVGIILGIAIIIAGISIMKNPAETWSTSSVDSCRFGADFYTEQSATSKITPSGLLSFITEKGTE